MYRIGGRGKRAVWGPAEREKGSGRRRPVQGQSTDKDAEDWVGGREEANSTGVAQC